MSDTQINQFVASGTAAEMAAFTPSPPTPASGPDNGYTFYNSDDGILYSWDGANWVAAAASGIALQAGTQTATSGTVIFSNSGGVTFGMSNSSIVTATVKTAYAGLNSAITNGSLTINSSGISINLPNYLTTAALSQDSSKYAGTNGAITGGSITVNTSGVSVNLPAYLTTAMASNRGSDFVAATAAFAGTNASGTIASNGISVSVAAPAAGSVNFSAGTTSNNLTQVSFKNSNGVSFGLDAGTITATVQTNYLTTGMASNRGSDFVQATAAFAGTNASGTIASDGISVSVAAAAGQSNQTVGLYVSSNTYLTSSGTVDARSMSFRGDKSITVGISAGEVLFSVGAYLTTAARSQDSSNYAGVNGAITGGSITVNTSGVSVNLPAYLTTAALSGDTSKYVQAWELTGNTAGTTSSAQGTKLYFSGGNSLTVSGNSNTVVFSVGNYLTTAALSGDTTKYVQAWELAGAHTLGTTSSAQGTKLYLSGGANVTISGNSNTLVFSAAAGGGGSINFSAGTTSGNLDSVVFSNSGAISFGLSGSTITASANTTSYNTAGSATTVYSVASANSVGTVTRWALEDHRHAGIGAIGISTGNTLGTTGSVLGTYWIAGSGALSVSQITSNNGSHTLVLQGAEGYNGWLEPYPLITATQTLLPTAGSWYLAPFTAFGSVSGGRVNFLAVNTGTANLFQDIGETAYKSNTTGTLNQSYTLSAAMAIFSQGTGANSSRLESVWSNSHSFGWSKVINVSTNAATNIAVSLAHSISYQSEIGSNGAYTNVQLAAAGSSTFANSSGASTGLSTVFSSGRNLISGSIVQPFGFSTTLSAGVYWMGYAWSTTRATASTGGQLGSAPDFGFSGLMGISRLAVDSLFRNFGSTTSGPRSMLIPYGVYTGGANMAPPSAIALSSDLSSLASQFVPYFNFNYRGLTK